MTVWSICCKRQLKNFMILNVTLTLNLLRLSNTYIWSLLISRYLGSVNRHKSFKSVRDIYTPIIQTMRICNVRGLNIRYICLDINKSNLWGGGIYKRQLFFIWTWPPNTRKLEHFDKKKCTIFKWKTADNHIITLNWMCFSERKTSFEIFKLLYGIRCSLCLTMQ